jgi:hypothetical protein
VVSNQLPLSTFKSHPLSSNLAELEFIQYGRKYSGNYHFQFPVVMSNIMDISTKNFSNFYLSSEIRLSDVIELSVNDGRSEGFKTTIKVGERHLSFDVIDPTPYANEDRVRDAYNYGAVTLNDERSDDSEFLFSMIDYNKCNIIFEKDNDQYYLATDDQNNIFFAKKEILSFDSNQNQPQDFRYLYSVSRNFISLFQEKPNGAFQVIPTGNTLQMVPVSSLDIYSSTSYYFQLENDLYFRTKNTIDQSFITYDDNGNQILNIRSKFDLKNNLLLHRPTISNQKLDIIILKNQLTPNDLFSCGNTLLSGGILPIDQMREYTTIFDDIQSEKDESLELNYVHYNQFYDIAPGENYIRTPSSMLPFQKLNINDTKFVNSGSFAAVTPELADKVFYLNSSNYKGANYLCTWLSSDSVSDKTVWVDRYYYPDLITKQDALSSKSVFSATYEDYIESLIQNNSNLKNDIVNNKIFDKMSDLLFEPDKDYIYDRFNINTINNKPEFLNLKCLTLEKRTNYFRDLNKNGKFTFGFFFKGNDESWVVESDRNSIDGGVKFEKNDKVLESTFSLYNPSTFNMLKFSFSKEINFLKENFVFVSIDSVNGRGYFYLNNIIVKSFKFPLAQYVGKRILFGDFFYYSLETPLDKTNLILSQSDNVVDTILLKDYVQEDIVFYLQLLREKIDIDNIQISLPCGMVNGTDNVTILNTVCPIFKSNSYDLDVKNLGIEDENILNDVESSISRRSKEITPVSSSLNKIKFSLYKR